VSSLAKIARSLSGPALEGIVTWHERDLTQSASERFVIPEAFILLDHMLGSITRILTGLEVHESRMMENLMRFKDPMMAEAVVVALVAEGMPRQEAHRLLQQIAFQSRQSGGSFRESLISNEAVSKLLSASQIDSLLNPKSYLGASKNLVDLAVEKTMVERRARGL